jgi:hypothetical protein
LIFYFFVLIKTIVPKTNTKPTIPAITYSFFPAFFSSITDFDLSKSEKILPSSIAVILRTISLCSCSSASNLLGSQVYTGTGTDQNLLTGGYTGSTLLSGATPTLTTTWQRFTQTATVSATATEITVLFTYTPVGTAGAADYFEVTGVQLEVGSTASAYAPNGATYQAELAACQRYYWRASVPSTSQSILAMGRAYNTTLMENSVALPVPMRIYPATLDYANISMTASGTTHTSGTWTLRNYGDTNQVYIEYVHGSGVFTAEP